MSRSNLLIILKGMTIGMVELIPGVSGGTIALIFGIYERLILSISNINTSFFSLFLRGKIREAWVLIDGNFLSLLFLGMALGVFSLSSLLLFFLHNFPLFLKSLFSGLILASLTTKPLRPDLLNKKWFYGFSLSALPILVIFNIQQSVISELSLVYLFIGGFISVCAFMLPGISGGFILLLLGLYPVVINALNEPNILLLSVFFAGCLIGILFFVRIIKTALDKQSQTITSFFFGLVLFSVPLIWSKIPSKSVYLINLNEFFELLFGLIFGVFFIWLIKGIRSS